MAKKNEPIRCLLHIPDGSGGYRLWHELSRAEQEAAALELSKRMGDALLGYVRNNPEVMDR